jgi:hypothetical protein
MLKWLTIQFRAQNDAMHEQALAAADDLRRGGVFSLSDADEPALEWSVQDSSIQFVGNAPWGVNHHTWVLQQVERLACTALRIGSVELEPYDYREEVSADGMLRLAARCTASASDLRYLQAGIGEAVDVTRVGISDAPRRMRLEDYAWGNGARGQGVVVRCVDAEYRVTLDAQARPEDSLKELLALLRQKGLLAQDEGAAIESRQHAARLVQNIDAWDL